MSILFPENIYCISCSSPISMKNPYSLCLDCYNNIVFLKDKYTAGDMVVNYLMSTDIIEEVYLATTYEQTMKNLIHGIKYTKKTYIAPYLATFLYEFIEFKKIDFDYICSTPIHKNRLNERGYNQVDIIAKYLSKLTDKKIVNPAKRVVDTVGMYHLDKKQRAEQMINAFRAENLPKLDGKTLLIIDDVLTTGATMINLAKSIKMQNPNTKITSAFVTRAVPKKEKINE